MITGATILADLRLVLVFCLLATAIARTQDLAQRGLTLAEAVARACQHHPLIIVAQQRVAIADAEKQEAGLHPNPMLTVSGENFPLGAISRLRVELLRFAHIVRPANAL